MLKTRVMPTLLYKDMELVKGISFDSWRKVGSLMQAIKVYNLRDVDELIFLDIGATNDGTGPDFELIEDFAKECFMPLTVGGGISRINDIKKLLKVGSDKVSINTSAILSPGLIEKAAKKFGSQCIVISIDVKKTDTGNYKVFTHSGQKETDVNPSIHANNAEKRGAGEILLTSIDRDGTMNGYDLEITRKVTETVHIPVIASGGAGNYQDMLSVIKNSNASAVAAASIYHFTEQTPIEAKHYLKGNGVTTRI